MILVSDKISFADFMLSPKFLEFNKTELPKEFPIHDTFKNWNNHELAEAINKIVRELLRRDAHGDKESPFQETMEEMHVLLYVFTNYLKSRL